MIHYRMTGLSMAVGAALLLAACGDTKLLGKTLPDETRVIDGPSLALPPQFELRPPRESADYETLLRAQKSAEARSLITGEAVSTAAPADYADVTPAAGSVPATDAWLVEQTSAQSGVTTDPNVRASLATPMPEEQAAKAKQGILARWFGYGRSE